MSVRVMAWVWEHSKSAPTQRLVLLAVADCANDRGTDAYPSTDTLAAKTGLTPRGVRKAVSELETLGEIQVEYKAGPRGCNRYRVIMRYPEPGAANPEPDSGSTYTRNDVPSEQGSGSTRNDVPGTRNRMTGDPERGSPEPSENHPPTEPSVEPSSSATRKRTRRSSTSDPPERADVTKICQHLADRIVGNGSPRPAIGAKWRDAARLLLDKDGRTVDQVTKAIDWCQDHEFWRGVVRSMPKLREQYDAMRLQAMRPNGRASPNGLVERDGLKLRPETAARIDDNARFAAMDAANAQPAIEGPDP